MNLSLESVKTSQELIHRGISSSQIRRARDAGGYTQLVRGCYCLTSEWMAWSQREKKLAQIVAHLKTPQITCRVTTQLPWCGMRPCSLCRNISGSVHHLLMYAPVLVLSK